MLPDRSSNQSQGRSSLVRMATIVGSGLLWMVLLTACNYPGGARPGDEAAAQSATSAASTVSSQITQAALVVNAPATQAATATVAVVPPTVSPTATRVQPTLPPPTPTSLPCDLGEYVADVTVPDGTAVKAGESYTKTWRLKNIGACTWKPSYDLVYSSGDRMGGSRSIPLDVSVRPGETVDLSVKLTAPEDPGTYRGYWELRDDRGRLFGIGIGGASAFWVDIRVERLPKVFYDFVEEYCDADWRNAGGFLPCPGSPDDQQDFVKMLEEPVLEGGRHENEPGLWTGLADADDAWISGEYPAIKVKEGDRFHAVVSCADGAPDCDVRFRLEYRIGSGATRTLVKADEKSEGKFKSIDVDLSDLAGEKVVFILSVQARSSTSDNQAIWLAPKILR